MNPLLNAKPGAEPRFTPILLAPDLLRLLGNCWQRERKDTSVHIVPVTTAKRWLR